MPALGVSEQIGQHGEQRTGDTGGALLSA